MGALATLDTLWRKYHYEQPQRLTLVILGIAGTYRRTDIIPSVVYVRKEIWGDLGRRYRRKFEPCPVKLRGSFPCEWTAPRSPIRLPEVTGLTLHTVSASLREARYWKRAYPEADIETQENAAYFLFGTSVGASMYCFRVLSNFVGHRQWVKEAALRLLHTFTLEDVVPLCERLMDRDNTANPR
ncbi:MAG: hypothetical protein NZZ60_07475 [Bacteroidia bacterium]|nr:hypothetical protein [Bacteroidia bacterium]